jgi:5'-nucleotidase
MRKDSLIALVDLGDTLADCTAALEVALRCLSSGADETRQEVGGDSRGRFEVQRRTVMHAPGFWRNLSPRPRGRELLRLLRDCGFSAYVVTKGPYDAPHVWGEKVAWCREHLPRVPVVVTDDKSRVHGHVLVDDWLPYVRRWKHEWPEGLAVLPRQPWNTGIELGPQCILDDESNDEVVLSALRGLRFRLKA